MPYSKIASADSDDFDLIVLSGGHSAPVIKNTLKLQNEIKLIKNSKTPILGICYGFELIAHVFGARLVEMPVKEKGVLDLKINVSSKIFNNLPNLRVYEAHRWIVKRISKNLKALAHSKDGIEAIKHRTRPIYGLQFHPEMLVDSTCGKTIIDNLLALLKGRA